MPARLVLVGAELVDRTGLVDLVFVDPADGVTWRVGVKSLRGPEPPAPPTVGGLDKNDPELPRA